MQLGIRLNILFLVLIYIFSSCHSKQDNKILSDDTVWEKIEPFFSPPSEYRNNFGQYRSPLLFYDGDPVENSDDWKKRRKEILDRWHSLMGEWPSFIKNQELEILEADQIEDFSQNRVRFNWTPGEQTEGYLLIPEGTGKKPAVVIVYYEPETAIGEGKENRDFAYQLTKRGFVTLSIGTTEATANKTYALYYPSIEKATVQPLSMLAYAAANAWYVLKNVQEVDPDRIAIAGHSFGGKWAMFASCLFDKYACAVWSDPGIVFDESRPDINYWEPWYLGYHSPPWRKRGIITEENRAQGLYPELIKNGYDLHELHALMAPRPFLVSGGSEDPPKRWIALNHSIAVNKLLGYENRVAMTNRPEHTPNSESNEQIYLFLEHFLKNR
jgi:dienelactone hydrolase